jgi:hypothetical protein
MAAKGLYSPRNFALHSDREFPLLLNSNKLSAADLNHLLSLYCAFTERGMPSLHRCRRWLRYQKCREATTADAAGVVFLVFDRKTTPSSRSTDASRLIFGHRSCGDARRGMRVC